MDWREERRGCGYSHYRKLSRAGHFGGLQRNWKVMREAYIATEALIRQEVQHFYVLNGMSQLMEKKLKIKGRGNSELGRKTCHSRDKAGESL